MKKPIEIFKSNPLIVNVLRDAFHDYPSAYYAVIQLMQMAQDEACKEYKQQSKSNSK